MRVLFPLVVLLSAASCVVVNEQCNPRTCNGCCTASGQCVDGNATNACGNGGNACSVCPGTFTCSLGTCQPGVGNGGGAGGGFGGGTGGGGGGIGLTPGNITFFWNFNGASCAQTPAVQSVRVLIPGQTLANGGVFPCSSGGVDGIQLLNFAGGSYSYTVEGLSASSAVLFGAAGNVTVNGDVQVNVTLTPSSSAPASIAFAWTFPANGASATPNCTEAGVTTVLVSLDGASPSPVACADGFAPGSVRFDDVTQGTHALTLEAQDSNQFTLYRRTTTIQAQVNPPTLSLLLDWAVGSLPVRWTFNNGVSIVNCAQAGVNLVNLNLRDSNGTLLYGTTGYDVPCTAANSLQGSTFPYLYEGTYELFLQAYGTGDVLYRSNFVTPPTGTVVNGQFPLLDVTTPQVLMTL